MDTYDPSKINFSFGNIDLNENFDPSKISFKFGESQNVINNCDSLIWDGNKPLKFNCECSKPRESEAPLKFHVDCTEHYMRICPDLWQEADGGNVNFDCRCNTFIKDPSDFNFSVDCSNVKDINLNFSVETGDEYNISFDDSIYVKIDYGTELETDFEISNPELDFKIEYGQETNIGLRAERFFNIESGYGEDVNIGFRTFPISYYSAVVEYSTGLDNFQLSLISAYNADAYYGHGIDATVKYSTYVTIPYSAEHGEDVTFVINTSKSFETQFEYDLTATAELTYYETKNFNVDSSHGEQSEFKLLTSKVYDVNVPFGEMVDFKLTDAPNENFIITFEHGSGVNNEVSTEYSLPLEFENGYDVDFEITLPYRFNIETNSYTGEVFEGDAYYGVAYVAYVEHGENVNFELATKTTINFDIEYDTLVDVILTDGFIYKTNAVVSYGEESSAFLTTSNSYTVSVEHGEQGIFNIKGSDNFAMLITMQYGHEFKGDMFYSQSLPIDAYYGTGVDFNIDTREPENPILTFEYGVEVTVTSLAQTYAYKFNVDQGEQVSVTSIGNVPNNYVDHGEDIKFALATQTTMDSKSEYGEQVTFNLKFAPSEPVGKFEIGHGEDTYINKIFIPFDPKFTVTMSLDFDVTNHHWMSMVHDLGLKSCCYDDQDILNIDLATEPDYDVYYDTDYKERVQFDLRTNAVLSFKIEDGYEFRAVDESTYMTMNFAIGSEMNTRDIDYELYIELNVGNVVLEPNDISVEINRPADEIPQMRRMYIGEEMKADMSYRQRIDPQVHDFGTETNFNLQTYEAWRVDFYYHSGLWAEINVNYGLRNIEMPIGASVGATFYVEPYYFDYGTEMELTEIHTKYDVEMTNSGCLANKYVELDANGFPIPNETGIEAIEGQPFMAYVEGRCF